MYDLSKAIEEVIQDCLCSGRGRLKRKDKDGQVILWIEAEWVSYDDTHDVVEVYFCYSDTGRVCYSQFINETITEKE